MVHLGVCRHFVNLMSQHWPFTVPRKQLQETLCYFSSYWPKATAEFPVSCTGLAWKHQECQSRFQWLHTVLHETSRLLMADPTAHPRLVSTGCESTAHSPSYLAAQGVPLFKRKKTKIKIKINRNKTMVCCLQTTNQIYTMRQTLKTETYNNIWKRGK